MRPILAPAAAGTVTLSNGHRIPRDTTFEDTLAGVSPLDHDPGADLRRAISADDDREGSGPPRFHGPAIALGPEGIEEVSAQRIVAFERPGGGPFADGMVDPEDLRRPPGGGPPRSSERIRQEVEGLDLRRDTLMREATLDGAFVRELALPEHHSTAPDDRGPAATSASRRPPSRPAARPPLRGPRTP